MSPAEGIDSQTSRRPATSPKTSEELCRIFRGSQLLMRYIRHHNQHAAPIKWAYRDFSQRIIATFTSAVTGH